MSVRASCSRRTLHVGRDETVRQLFRRHVQQRADAAGHLGSAGRGGAAGRNRRRRAVSSSRPTPMSITQECPEDSIMMFEGFRSR